MQAISIPLLEECLDFGSSSVFPIGVAMHTQAMAHKALLTELSLAVMHVHCWDKLMRGYF